MNAEATRGGAQTVRPMDYQAELRKILPDATVVDNRGRNLFEVALPIPSAVVDDGQKWQALQVLARASVERARRECKPRLDSDDVGLDFKRVSESHDQVAVVIEATTLIQKDGLNEQQKRTITESALEIARSVVLPQTRELPR